MNKNSMNVLALLLLLLGSFSACNEGKQEVEVAETTTMGTEVAYDGPVVRLEAEGEYVLDALRMGFTVSGGNAPALSPPTADVIPVHCIIRSSDPEQPATSVTLRWRRQGTSLTYSYKESAFNLAQGTDLSQGKWYMAGVIGGSLNNREHTVTFGASNLRAAEIGETLDLNVPFMFSWQPLEVVEVKGQMSLRLTSDVRFMPQGVLLRYNFTNEMYNAWTVSTVTVRTNAFSDSGTFAFNNVTSGPTWTSARASKTFSQTGAELGAPPSGYEMGYTLQNGAGTAAQPERLAAATPATAGVAKMPTNNQRYYLSWAMPATGVADPWTAIYANMTAVDPVSGAEVPETKNMNYHVFYSGSVPVNGRTYLLRMVIRRPPMALEYMAEYNLKGDKVLETSFDYIDASGVSTAKYYDVPNYLGSMAALEAQIMPDGYHLPGTNELRGALVGSIEAGNPVATKTTPTSSDKTNPTAMEERNSIGYKSSAVSTMNYYTYHYAPMLASESALAGSQAVGYGLRWTSLSTANQEKNLFASAWRYEYVDDLNPGTPVKQPALIIRARYLGPVYQQTFQQIADKDWWGSNSTFPKDDEVERVLPLTGYISRGRVSTGEQFLVGKHAVLMITETKQVSLGRQATVGYYRPAKMGVITNVNAFYYDALAGSPFPSDVSTGPSANVLPAAQLLGNPSDYSKVSLSVRPFVNHDFRRRYLPKR